MTWLTVSYDDTFGIYKYYHLFIVIGLLISSYFSSLLDTGVDLYIFITSAVTKRFCYAYKKKLYILKTSCEILL